MAEMRTWTSSKVLIPLLIVIVVCADIVPADDATVRIDTDVRHQTILGFSAMPWYLGIAPEVRDQVLDEVIQELGLTWVHWTVPSGNRSNVRSWERSNDDGDPLHINWSAFGTEDVDRSVRTWVLPFKQRVEARGDRFGLAVTQTFHNGGSTGPVPQWLIDDPEEFAEYAVSLLVHLKKKHGIETDYYVICKDAGTPGDNPFSVNVVTEMTKAVGPRLRAAGLRTSILFPECHDANTSWRFIQAAKDDADFWPFVGMIGYHVYGDEAHNSDRGNIRRFAVAKGLPTGHAGSDQLSINTLYDDLTVYPHPGENLPPTVTAWEAQPSFLKTPAGELVLSTAAQDPELDRISYAWTIRQQPVGARVTLAAPHAATTSATGLTSPGRYTFQVVASDGHSRARREVNVNVFVGNQPPRLIDVHNRLPVVITLPQDTTELRGGALDLEGSELTFRWSIVSQPAGSAVRLESPDQAKCKVANITTPGDHVFQFEVGDGESTVAETLTVPVYPASKRHNGGESS